MNELAWRHHFPVISLWEFFRCSRAPNPLESGPIWPKWDSSEILCLSSLPASLNKIWSKTIEKRWRHRFPHWKSMSTFCCHGNQSFDPICPKNLMQPYPYPSDATRKIGPKLANWPQRYSSSNVWTDNGRAGNHLYTISLWFRWDKIGLYLK